MTEQKRESSSNKVLEEIKSQYSQGHEDSVEGYLRDSARALLEGRPLTFREPSISYFLEPADIIGERVDSRYEDTIRNEIIKYVIDISLSEDAESVNRFNYFFSIPTAPTETHKVISKRVLIAMNILEILSRDGIEITELSNKLFDEIYLENGVLEMFDRSFLDYSSEIRDLIFYFERSEFYDNPDERNSSKLREILYEKIVKIYKSRDKYLLGLADYDMRLILKELFLHEWFMQDEIQQRILEDTGLQNSLLRLDVLMQEDLDYTGWTQVDVFKENLPNFEYVIEERRKNILKENIDIFTSNIKDLSEEDFLTELIVGSGGHKLFSSVMEISQINPNNDEQFLEDIVADLLGSNPYTREAVTPFLRDLLLDLEEFYIIEEYQWYEFIYTNTTYLLHSLGERVGIIEDEIKEFVFKRIKDSVLELRQKIFLSDYTLSEDVVVNVFDQRSKKKYGLEDVIDDRRIKSIKIDRRKYMSNIHTTEDRLMDFWQKYQSLKTLLELYS